MPYFILEKSIPFDYFVSKLTCQIRTAFRGRFFGRAAGPKDKSAPYKINSAIMKGMRLWKKMKRVSFGQAVILLVIAIAVIIIVKAWLAADTSVSLLCAAAPVCALAMIWGVKWDDIETEIKENFKSMCSPVMILMCVGMLVGTWTISGTIPSLVYYGMQFISPGIFLVVTCLIGALMSIMTGTSWGTISTAGVALMGVSIGLGILRHIRQERSPQEHCLETSFLHCQIRQ